MSLPIRDYAYYCGIDPGFKGAFALMSSTGTTAHVWPMPVVEKEHDRQREIDLNGLRAILEQLRRFPNVCIGLEWPTTRPGEGAERCERFGRQKGYLEAFCFLKGLDYYKIAPNLWKGRLGLDGKTVEGANERAAKLFETYYPAHVSLIRGPKGGIQDGRMDALLIAHFLRTRGGQGMKSVVRQFGRDSVQAFALIMGGGRRKRKFGKRSTDL
jgi:hypothetical protein